MKKTWLKVAVSCLTASALLTFAACGPNEPPHEHSYQGYQSDESGHWQVCTDGDDKTATETHTFDDEFDADCNVCGYVREVLTKKEKAIKVLEDLNTAPEGLNTYVSSYDEVVKHLTDKGVISSEATPVNINETAGYLYSSNFNDKWELEGFTISEEALPVADKAYDYDGVYLFWWDVANGSDLAKSVYTSLRTSDAIVLNGGQYTLATTCVSGYYAIAYKSVIDTIHSTTQNSGESYNDFQTRKNAAIDAAEEACKSKTDIFKAIPAVGSIDDYSMTEVAAALQKAGLIDINNLTSPVDLNAEYSCSTGNVALAHQAKQYGGIRIYYYDESDSWYSFSYLKVMYEALKEKKETPVYYDNLYGASFGYWYTEGNTFSYGEDKSYNENGTALTIKADLVLGHYVFVIDL